jgi:plasmid stabilization system protein ParE
MTVVWSAQLQDDLREIRKFIASDAPDTATAYIRRLRKSVNRLRSFPDAGVVVTEAANSRIREIYFGQYRIIYEITPSRIEILTVYHGARLLDETEF